jgi:hypothetical protein
VGIFHDLPRRIAFQHHRLASVPANSPARNVSSSFSTWAARLVYNSVNIEPPISSAPNS